LDVELKSKTGTLKIVTAQETLDAAKVTINDAPLPPGRLQIDKANDTLLIDDVPPGSCKITFDNGNPDYVIVERHFDIKPGDEYTWAVIPKLAAVPLFVVTDPHTTVYLDNEPKGETTPEGKLQLNDVKIGKHEVRF